MLARTGRAEKKTTSRHRCPSSLASPQCFDAGCSSCLRQSGGGPGQGPKRTTQSRGGAAFYVARPDSHGGCRHPITAAEAAVAAPSSSHGDGLPPRDGGAGASLRPPAPQHAHAALSHRPSSGAQACTGRRRRELPRPCHGNRAPKRPQGRRRRRGCHTAKGMPERPTPVVSRTPYVAGQMHQRALRSTPRMLGRGGRPTARYPPRRADEVAVGAPRQRAARSAAWAAAAATVAVVAAQRRRAHPPPHPPPPPPPHHTCSPAHDARKRAPPQ